MTSTLIVYVIPDVMAATRVVEAARKAGLEIVASEPDALVRLSGTPGAQGRGRALEFEPVPTLAVVDLQGPSAMPAIEAAARAGIRVVAYGPHVDEEALRLAREAGAGHVVPRGLMMRDPAGVIRAALAQDDAPPTDQPA